MYVLGTYNMVRYASRTADLQEREVRGWIFEEIDEMIQRLFSLPRHRYRTRCWWEKAHW